MTNEFKSLCSPLMAFCFLREAATSANLAASDFTSALPKGSFPWQEAASSTSSLVAFPSATKISPN
ncbi:hypothetical protein HZA55_09830 [Candidatus Poribacteria bacterium]|nr:hypothetical protein [Candidatus Poribacteria bacterium]